MNKTELGYNVQFSDLYSRSGIQKIHSLFLNFLKNENYSLYRFLKQEYKKNYTFGEDYCNEINEVVEISKILENFLVGLFKIENSINNYKAQHNELYLVFLFRTQFINKKVKPLSLTDMSEVSFEENLLIVQSRLSISGITSDKDEIKIAQAALYGEDEELKVAIANIGYFILYNPEIQKQYQSSILFFKPKKVDFKNLIDYQNKKDYTNRDGFNLYRFTNKKESIHNSVYCIKCHSRGKDSCRFGLKDKEDNYQVNPLGNKLEGCPIGMHISQMHVLYEMGYPIASLIAISINNPLALATGNSICNDCSKACIFQKQSPVNTPFVETQVVNDCLNLDWGFEIYSLLCKWNPLRVFNPLPKAKTNKSVFVSGLGPAGFSMAYSMAQEGHNVIATDLMNIQKLPKSILHKPIRNISEIQSHLEERKIYHFGGVTEYGITSRWNKNNLTYIYIILSRYKNIHIEGNIRFGSSITLEDVKRMDFSHVVLCHGSGKPNLLNIENSLAKGIKTASEFLMALNLGAYKKESNHFLPLRLPIGILGAGLTAVDTASEALSYYIRMLHKVAPLCQKILENENIRSSFSKYEIEVLKEYNSHYKLIQNKNYNDAIKVINSLGGCYILARGVISETNAYKNNHEELENALDLGVKVIENIDLKAINIDKEGYISSITCNNNQEITLKSLFFAMGTNPNNIAINLPNQNTVIATKNKNITYKNQKVGVNTIEFESNKYISILGDMHATFSGSVVKAIASAFYSRCEINKQISNTKQSSIPFYKLKEAFSKINKVTIKSYPHGETHHRVVIKNKNLYNKYFHGMIVKLQDNSSNNHPLVLSIVGKEKNKLISYVKLRGEASSMVIENNHNLSVLGPLGQSTDIPYGQSVLFIVEDIYLNSLISFINKSYEKGSKITVLCLYYKNKHLLHKIIAKEVHKNNEVVVTYIKADDKETLANTLRQSSSIDVAFTALKPSSLSTVTEMVEKYHQNCIFYHSTFLPMNCVSGGICGTCLTIDKKGNLINTCINRQLKEVNIENITNRTNQNSLIEKILKTTR